MAVSKSQTKTGARGSQPRKRAVKPSSKTGPLAAGGSTALRANRREVIDEDASGRIDERIRALGGWRAKTLVEVRRMIRAADREIVEECKWIKATNPLGVPVWSHGGIVCTGEAYKEVVKLTFLRGASLADPAGLFNSSLEGAARRAIDIREGEMPDETAFTALIRSAVAENVRLSEVKGVAAKKTHAKERRGVRAAGRIKEPDRGKATLLSGGNPQIAKGDGNAPVKAYIAAMPGWTRRLGARLDALIVETVPGVRKAVKWNSPFYGVEGRGWFLSFHVFTRYVKVTFFRGTSLRPVPPGGTQKSKDARWIDLEDGDEIDTTQMAKWIRQAAALPGWTP